MNDTLFNEAVSLTYGWENYIIYPYRDANYSTSYYIILDNDMTYTNGFVYSPDVICYHLYSTTAGNIIDRTAVPTIPANCFYYGTVGLYAPAYESVSNAWDALDHSTLSMFASLILAGLVVYCYVDRFVKYHH